MLDLSEPQKYFFVHIMRTGGATFSRQIVRNFERNEVYPDPDLDPDMHKANFDIPYILGLSSERTKTIRVYTGHFPFFVSGLLGATSIRSVFLLDGVGLVVLTILVSRLMNVAHAAKASTPVAEEL